MQNLNEDTESLFYIMEDGNKMQHKIINLNNPKICPREGVIEIEALKKKDVDLILENKATISIYRDLDTGIIWGIPIGIHPVSKEIRFKKIRLSPNTFFDRRFKDQADMCAIALKCISNNIPSRNNRPIYKIRDKEAIAKGNAVKRSLMKQALDVAEGLSYGEQLRTMARNIGIAPEGLSDIVLHDKVCEYATLRPKEFMDMWNDPQREYLSILNKAKSFGIIEHDMLLGYKYNGYILGQTLSLAVMTLKEKPDMAQSIATLTAKKEEDTIKSMSSPVVVKATEVFGKKQEPAGESDIEKIKRENEELRKLLEEKQRLTAQLTDKNDDADEMATLRKRAGELGIKGANLPSISKETLKAKIAEKEQVGPEM